MFEIVEMMKITRRRVYAEGGEAKNVPAETVAATSEISVSLTHFAFTHGNISINLYSHKPAGKCLQLTDIFKNIADHTSHRAGDLITLNILMTQNRTYRLLIQMKINSFVPKLCLVAARPLLPRLKFMLAFVCWTSI